MAHNLNFNPQLGYHSFVSARERAWHNLGAIKLDGQLTSAECIRMAGLDRKVIKVPNFALIDDNYVNTEAYSTVMADTKDILGDKLGRGYTLIQNVDAFKFFDSLVGMGEAYFETAGLLGKGEVIFICAKLPSYIHVGGDDIIENYFLLVNGHDGKLSLIAAFTPIRTVCNNTMNLALANATRMIRIRHTANVKTNLAQAAKLLEISNSYTKNMTEVFQAMAKKPIVEAQLKDIIKLSIASSLQLEKVANNEKLSKTFDRAVDLAMEYAHSADSQMMPTTKGTVFGALNAVTGFYQNVYDFDDSESMFRSTLLGGRAQQAGQRAFELCVQMIK